MIKFLHSKGIVDLYHHLKADNEMIVNVVRAAEAIENIKDMTEKVENPLELQFFLVFFNVRFFKAKTEKVKIFL